MQMRVVDVEVVESSNTKWRRRRDSIAQCFYRSVDKEWPRRSHYVHEDYGNIDFGYFEPWLLVLKTRVCVIKMRALGKEEIVCYDNDYLNVARILAAHAEIKKVVLDVK
jgi:hypothetical protein